MKKFKRRGKFYAYIVRCRDGTYYTGYTPDIRNRLKLHNNGKGAKYTRSRRPVKLVWCKEYKYFKNAVTAEIAIKKLSHEEKEKLAAASKSKQSRRFLRHKKNLDINVH